MSDKSLPDRRFKWLVAGLVINTVISLSALALWFFRPTGFHAERAAPIEPSVANPSRLTNPPPPPRRYSQLAPAPPEAPPGISPAMPSVPGMAPGIVDTLQATSAPPSTLALGERLHLRADLLATALGDEKGEIPPAYVQRLDRAQDAAVAFAKREHLNEVQTQSVTAVFMNYAFNVLREEKQAGPVGPDPTRIEAFQAEVVASLLPTCGEETSKAAEKEIDDW